MRNNRQSILSFDTDKKKKFQKSPDLQRRFSNESLLKDTFPKKSVYNVILKS